MTIQKIVGNLSGADKFKMTGGRGCEKLSEHSGEKIKVGGYILFTDTNGNGDEKTVLSFKSEEGVFYSTNSKSFVEGFMNAYDFCEDGKSKILSVTAVKARSKGGRDYLTFDCDIVEA
jgi:cytoplasmic iron level regulating protein YaaA (DUF328/UPF0246 family)